jgi:hypothetical protein
MPRRLVLLRTKLLLVSMSLLAACGKASDGWPDSLKPRKATPVTAVAPPPVPVPAAVPAPPVAQPVPVVPPRRPPIYRG